MVKWLKSTCTVWCLFLFTLDSVTQAQDVIADPMWQELKLQLEMQAQQIQELRTMLEQSQSEHDSHMPRHEPVTSFTDDESCLGSTVVKVPLETEIPWMTQCGVQELPKAKTLDYFVDYDDGFVVKPFDPQKQPFEARLNGWIQFRHHGFDRDVDTWTDNAGIVRPVDSRNAFDIERARIQLSGYAVDERLTYFLQLDGDTDGAHSVDFFDYWWAWQLTDSFQIQMGKRKVTASRQWLLGARRTRFVERPMANDFFRPDRTVGLFGVGEIGEGAHYEVMIGNGYFSANVPNSAADNRFTYAVTNYFEPLGAFGGQLVDFKATSDPLLQFGHSFVFSPQNGDSNGAPLPEADFLRLSDGTRLTQPGALTPGITVSEFDLYFYGLDAAIKWNGYSFNAEVFFRWIEDIKGNGALTEPDLYQTGFYVEGGKFIIPQKLDWNVRYSQVNGKFGKASEYAAGFNWYPLSSHQVKISFDVTSLDSSPLNNTTSDILVGDDGTLFRTQFQAEF